MRVSSIELRMLRDFVAIVEHKSFRAAALALHVSQPPLTRHIQQLEEALGAALFIRTARGVELTDAGAIYYEDAQNILALSSSSAERAHLVGQGQAGRLDIGVYGSAMFDTIPRIVRRFRELHPRVEIVMHTLARDSQTKALRDRRISVAFNRLFADEPDLHLEIVQTENLHAVVQAHHPLARRSELGLKDIAKQTLVVYPHYSRPSFRDYVLRLFHRAGVEPGATHEVDDLVAAISLVSSGFGVTLATESARCLQMPGVCYVPVRKADGAVLDLVVAYRAGDSSTLLAAFLDVVRSFGATPGRSGRKARSARRPVRGNGAEQR